MPKINIPPVPAAAFGDEVSAVRAAESWMRALMDNWDVVEQPFPGEGARDDQLIQAWPSEEGGGISFLATRGLTPVGGAMVVPTSPSSWTLRVFRHPGAEIGNSPTDDYWRQQNFMSPTEAPNGYGAAAKLIAGLLE
jgi:hypothetical protein